MTHFDVVVVGAGPAGSLAAREVARRGRSVLLLDRSVFPRHKVCGACLGAGALEVLAFVGLGALPASLGAEPLATFVLCSKGRSASLRLPGGCAVSRAALDGALVDAARDAGVVFRGGTRAALGPVVGQHRAVHLSGDAGAADVLAGVVLDATGLGAGLTAPAGAPARVARGSRVGLGATFSEPGYPVAPGELHMAVGATGYVGLVRVETGALNVAAAVDPAALRAEGASPGSVVADILSQSGLPLPSSAPIQRWQGTPALTRTPGAVGSERLFRVGDAAGYVEPFTGEGMSWATSAAVAVAPLAVAAMDGWRSALLDAWREYHRTALGGSRRLCGLIAAGLRRPGLVEGALAALGAFPGLADPLVRRVAQRPPSVVECRA